MVQVCSSCSFIVTSLCLSLCQCINLCDMAVPQARAAATALDRCDSCHNLPLFHCKTSEIVGNDLQDDLGDVDRCGSRWIYVAPCMMIYVTVHVTVQALWPWLGRHSTMQLETKGRNFSFSLHSRELFVEFFVGLEN